MMEEEVGIKVTRLRRRLSVESDDVKSPSTQSTPTKKRGGRLAAKPQLELIDENAPEAAPKRTRKSTARDIAEPIEEKLATPSRRSTRIRSNTSIVSETPGDGAEDKGTPSRRSTRIKSNTSIVAESVQSVNSPRAKRAARRTSQVGSDNETSVTPARATRRTRKDSTSSVDKQADVNAGIVGSQTNEVIVEETETNGKETKSSESPISVSSTLRKSPRLVGNNGRKSISLDSDNKENKPQSDKETCGPTTDANKSVAETKSEQLNEIIDQITESNNLSVASSNLIKELDNAPKKGKNMNKSTTAVEEPQIKSKRNRTKSWTTISVEPSHENSFCSDSEASKKKSKNKHDSLNLSNISGSGDGIMNISNKNEKESKTQEKIEVSLNSSILSEKKKKKRHERSIRDDTEISVFNQSENLIKSTDKKSLNEDGKNSKEEEVTDSMNISNKQDSRGTEKLFEQAPTGLIQSLVFIDDSDSNQDSTQKDNIDKDFDSGDQCVPVVDHHLDDSSKETKNNLSYEPMDIDETMPENISLTTYTEKNISIRQEDQEPKTEKRKSILNNSQVKNNISINKSKRKSSISNIASDDNMKEESNKSQKNTSSVEIINNIALDKDSNKSKRKSSISTNAIPEDTTDGISYTSDRKSVNMDSDNANNRRKSSIPNVVTENNEDANSNESLKESSTLDINEIMNKSKKNTSNIVTIPDNNTSKISNKSKRKSSFADIVTEKNLDKSLNKSKRKSSDSAIVAEVSIGEAILPISNIDNDVSMEKSFNKSQSKSSISPIESQTFDKTDNENKSTLVLSQFKDVSETDINMNNASKDIAESNENEKSKSISVSYAITEKKRDNKNISLTYKTSTPLQQKTIKKLGMNINSSIIAPNSASKVDQKITLDSSKKKTSVSRKVDSSDSSEEEDSSEDEDDMSCEKSKIIDDEAEEASDDYESGDSRDEDEKEYEEQNEIVEKGETLDTEDENEYSDDSEYEKGSFIVSSDEEDDDLLSGSGDDLSLSADELSMSAKSKKKYNERKLKEQKKASREMFEARHKNESEQGKSSKQKSKKNNRQRFDSSSSDSNEEVTAQTNKNRRQRIDSSEDISMVQPDVKKSMSQKKKKVKRLSESVCEDDATNEKEITIREETEMEKMDPLTLQNVIKEEPKTPQKDFNISTIAVTNMDEVEEVNVDENISMMKSNQTCDPLQDNIVENYGDDIDDEDSISENEEIAQNYESVLNNLNVSNSKKIKSSDISLNLERKTKQKPKQPIVDQLNLTQIKNTKKTKGDALKTVTANKSLEKSLIKKGTDKVDTPENMFSEGSSDSIDMKLLFPEDSNDSEVLVKNRSKGKKQDANESTQKEDVQNSPENFIPLKRTEGKTNMLENLDITPNLKDESVLNVSNKKKNRRKSSQTEEALKMSIQDDDVGFFIDTTGTLNDIESTDVNTSIQNSVKKNKHKNNVSFTNIEEAKVDDDSNDAPLEVSYHSEKSKSKQNSILTQNKHETEEPCAFTEIQNESAKKKKKNKKSLNSSQSNAEISMIVNTDDVAEKSINSSVTKGSAKKKKMSESQIELETENTEHAETIQNISLNSTKKQKQKAILESSAPEEETANDDDKDVINEEVMSKKRKRKSSANQTIIEEIIDKDDIKLNTPKPLDDSLLTKNQKKKRKYSNNDNNAISLVQDSVTDQLVGTLEHENVSAAISNNKDKLPLLQTVDAVVEEATKKNKKRKAREDDDACKISKVPKQNSLDKVYVPRLPVNVISQLGDKPKEILDLKKPKVISTTSFEVKETKKRGKNPSSYLEESVYLNDDVVDKKKKGSIKYPKTLPSIPSALTSVSGFTTNFRVNPITQQTQFLAQSSDISNFKNDYLNKKRIKKLGTFELYKRQRNIKISKF